MYGKLSNKSITTTNKAADTTIIKILLYMPLTFRCANIYIFFSDLLIFFLLVQMSLQQFRPAFYGLGKF